MSIQFKADPEKERQYDIATECHKRMFQRRNWKDAKDWLATIKFLDNYFAGKGEP